MQSAAAVALMPLVIFWCVHCSSDNAFQWVVKPPKLPLPIWASGLDFHLTHGSWAHPSQYSNISTVALNTVQTGV